MEHKKKGSVLVIVLIFFSLCTLLAVDIMQLAKLQQEYALNASSFAEQQCDLATLAARGIFYIKQQEKNGLDAEGTLEATIRGQDAVLKIAKTVKGWTLETTLYLYKKKLFITENRLVIKLEDGSFSWERS
ncbi:MAG: hypothetical protein WCI30_01265 [Clostridia bacterium]